MIAGREGMIGDSGQWSVVGGQKQTVTGEITKS